MGNRMDRYNISTTTASRSDKNQKLYNQMDNIDVEYIDLKNDREVDLSEVGTTVSSREDFHRLKGVGSRTRERNYEEAEEETDNKVYDINELLSKARENHLFVEKDNKKRFINTEYNILTKLDLEHIEEEKEEMKKENLRSLIDTIYSNDLASEVKKADNKALMAELMPTEIVIDEEISKKILDDKKEDVKKDLTDPIKKTNEEELAELINKTFIGTRELIKDVKSEEPIKEKVPVEENNDFEGIDKTDKKWTIIIVIVSVLIVLAIAGLILGKYLGAF